MQITDKQKEQIDMYFKDMHDMLYSYAVSALNDTTLAEEAVQDAFVVACCKPDALLTSPNPRGWLVATLKYSIAGIRKSQHHMKMLYLACKPPMDDIAAENPENTIRYMDSLSACRTILEDDFELFIRIARDQYTMLEAAEEFNISVEACKKRIQRSRAKLKKFFEK